MNQFVELRHNRVLMPASDPKGQPKVFDELIFISAQRTYEVDAQFNPAQKVETLVSRMVCDEAGKHNMICELAMILSEKHTLRLAVEKWMEEEAARRQKKGNADLFSQPH